jgi:hypothetical protein
MPSLWTTEAGAGRVGEEQEHCNEHERDRNVLPRQLHRRRGPTRHWCNLPLLKPVKHARELGQRPQPASTRWPQRSG